MNPRNLPHPLFRRGLMAFALLLLPLPGIRASLAAEVTPSGMYAQALRIEQEVETLKRHFKISAQAHSEVKSGDLKPRHIWAKTYILLFKLGKLRRQLGLTYIQPGGSEPSLDTKADLPWGTLQRVLTEIQIIKYYLDIPGQPPAPAPVTGKRVIDVHNKLHHVSAELDLLTSPVTPSEVYGEVKRLNEDVDAVLRHLRIFETTVPPPRREGLQPKDSLRAVFALLEEIQRIQRQYGMETVDFKGFDLGDKTVPDDVFGLVELTLTEWQRVKARLGMIHHITVPASYEEGKVPADVVQLLGYVSDKLRAIKAR